MAEHPQTPNDDDIDRVFNDIVVEHQDLQYSSLAQVTENMHTVMQRNLDQVRLFAQSRYEIDPPVSEADFHALQSNEVEAYGALAAVIMSEDNEMDDKLKTMAAVSTHAADTRAELFNKLVPSEYTDDEHFIAWSMEAIERYFNKLLVTSENIDQLISGMKQHYLDDILDDYTSLMEHLDKIAKDRQQSSAPASPREMTLSIRRSAKDHLLDVAKITAGVLGALAVDRMLRRRS